MLISDMENKRPFDLPILFVIFRRKGTALQVIEAISKVKPTNLYISQDGPRNSVEEKQIIETRKAVLSKIDWKCNLTVWTHDKNLGLRRHIPEAFDKFFKKEELGIYLEDDTIPNKDFFYFQKDMLERYKNDNRIFYVQGTNLYPDLMRNKGSYVFTQIGNVWGLGIWKRSWKLYDRKILIDDFNYLNCKDYIFDRKYLIYFKVYLNAVKNGHLDSWANQLDYAALKNKLYFVQPSVNLVKNVGINKGGTNPFLQNYDNNSSGIYPISRYKEFEYGEEDKNRDKVYFDKLLRFFYFRIVLINIYLYLPSSVKQKLIKVISFISRFVA